MNITITGTIERKGLGTGTWALVSDDGKNYEIYQPAPKELLKTGIKAKINGKIRDDVMTLAMIGPVLEVQSFKLID